MILATRHGDRQLRAEGGMFAGLSAIPLPSVGVGMGEWSVAGRRVTPEIAEGLPAALRGVRVLTEVLATMPLLTIRATEKGDKIRATDAWQWRLLHEKPNDTQKSPFTFKEYCVCSMVARGNAYCLKAKARGRVVALYPLSPRRVTPRYLKDGETLVYDVRNAGAMKTVTEEDMLHIPGVLLDDPRVGVSPFTVAHNAIGSALGTEEYVGRFFDNDGSPGGVLEFPQSRDSQAAKDTRDAWEDRHRGARNAHRIAALYGGTKYKEIGLSAHDMQMIEAQKWNVEQVARILGLPAWILGGPDQNPRSTPEQRNTELVMFSLSPWMKRFEEGLHADDDLFPDKLLFPYFEADELVRAELALRYQAYLQARQGGWFSINDARRKENMPPIEGGDVYQITPVGGAPNLQPEKEADLVDLPDDPTM